MFQGSPHPYAANDTSHNGNLRVAVCSPSEASEWNSFVGSQPNGSFYHLNEWSHINHTAFGHTSCYLIARDAREIRGVLPLTLLQSRLFGRIACSVPFLNYGGPCATDAASVQKLLDAARSYSREVDADYLEVRCADAIETDTVASTRKISMTINLDPDPEVLWNKFASKHRTNIRRSYKNGLAVTSGGIELLPTFYAVMQQSWRDLGTPLYSRRYFAAILNAFPDSTRIFVCSRGIQAVAVAFNGYFNGTAEGMWAGGTAEARSLQANYVLYWEMIMDACKRGLQRYHLGRSTADSGAEDFKKKWNAHSRQLYWYFEPKAGRSLPNLTVENPKYQLAIAAWRRLPIWATHLIGPPIARQIP